LSGWLNVAIKVSNYLVSLIFLYEPLLLGASTGTKLAISSKVVTFKKKLPVF